MGTEESGAIPNVNMGGVMQLVRDGGGCTREYQVIPFKQPNI